MPRRPVAVPASVRDRIALAWEKRLHLRQIPPLLSPSIDQLCMLRRPTVTPSARAFEVVGTRRTQNELLHLASALAVNDPVRITDAITSLHAPAIMALAKIGLMRHDLQSDARPAYAARRVVDLAAKIKLERPKGGRPKQNHAQIISRIVVLAYDRVWKGCDMLPDPEYTLPRLVGDIFRILGVTADARGAARAALAWQAKQFPSE